MLECFTCRVTFHKLQLQEIDSEDGSEPQAICPFCKAVLPREPRPEPAPPSTGHRVE